MRRTDIAGLPVTDKAAAYKTCAPLEQYNVGRY
jgi:hypothetical protein